MANHSSSSGQARPRLVVGMGASAGGLEACKAFFQAMPADSGMAFVVVMHLDPSHESHVANLLGSWTRMPVVQIDSQKPVEADCVYVIAPATTISIKGGVLVPGEPKEPHGQRKPVDAFFASLAEDQRERAVAIILSGNGGNGSSALMDVRTAGGLCLAQDPATAQYAGMPRSAIATGLVDRILAPQAMPSLLLEHAGGALVVQEGPAVPADPDQIAFESILKLLARRYRLDFRAYKTGTLRRRAERRMSLANAADWVAYRELLELDANEVEALYSDLLIDVTRFFRDREVWALVAKEIIPPLLERRAARADEAIRVWVAGCASGEEAYTLAMLFMDQMQERGTSQRLQVYATDVHAESLAAARQGVYPLTIAADVDPAHLARYFRREGDAYQVVRELRDTITFASHNLLGDPPFSRIDLVSCRNVLIYFEAEAHERVFGLMNFALQPGGVLILGSSETTGRSPELFEAVSKAHRVYRAAGVGQRHRHDVPSSISEGYPPPRQPALATLPLPPPRPRIDRVVEQRVLSRYTSASIAINRNLQILATYGPTGEYLTQPVGETRLDLLAWVKPGLYTKLRQALHQAIETKDTVTLSDVWFERPGGPARIECIVEPVLGAEGTFLVVLRDLPLAEVPAGPAEATKNIDLVRQLESELRSTRGELQSTVEQLDSLNEEFRAGHEELLSLNEELQSSNEELETSKEELQSLNEELATINRQLEDKNRELRGVNTDLRNLLSSTEIPTIFLDRHLRIRQFTPAATEVMRLVPSDAGRSIEHIKERIRDERLVPDAQAVLEKLTPIQVELATDDGRWVVRRITPYRSEDERIEGVCITFTDVTQQKRATARADEARLYAEAIIATIRTPLIVLDADQRVISANESFYGVFEVAPQETLGRPIYDLGNRQWDIPALRLLLEKLLPERQSIRDFDVEHDFEKLGRRRVLVNAYSLAGPTAPEVILMSLEDVTQRRRAEQRAASTEEELAREYRRKDEFLAMLGHELRNPLSAIVGGLELWRRAAGDRERSEQARDMMVRQVTRLSSMLDQILDVARVVSGRVEINRELVDLAEIARAAVDGVTPLVQSRKLELSVSSPDRLLVRGDAVRLTQVFENLLTNAAKYTDEGGHIWLTLGSDGNVARVVVKDTGVGIDGALLPHVFELFTQEQRTLDRSKGGLGLGLPLVRRLTEVHGGHVEASSAGRGKGSEFVVTLPLVPVRSLEDRSEVAPALGTEVQPRRVLVVEDENDARDTLEQLLRFDGHQVAAVRNGQEALEAARRVRPEVAFVDLGLPGMDGYAVARRLREEHGERLRLIAMTGYQRDSERLATAGFDAHLLKPVDPLLLAGHLAALSDGQPRLR